MKRKRFSQEQISRSLKEAEAGVAVKDVRRKYGMSDASFYTWRAKYGGMDVFEAKRLHALEDENHKLKQIVAEQAPCRAPPPRATDMEVTTRYTPPQRLQRQVRPMPFFDRNDPRLADRWDEYMFGPDLLVAPVWKVGQRSRRVYFPKGTWHGYFQPGLVFTGPRSVDLDVPLDEILVFKRDGAAVPGP